MAAFLIFLLIILALLICAVLAGAVKFAKDGINSVNESKNWPKTFENNIRASISKHKYSLAQESKRLTAVDAYGKADASEWENDGVDYFITNILWPEIGLSELKSIQKTDDPMFDFISPGRAKILEMINEEIGGIKNSSLGSNDINELSGIEFETICKESLESTGWHITTTVASGDQGVDLIATKGGTRVCIQCKRFSSPVGNSAVQEVTAGKLHWHGTHAVVVSNAGFTKSARALARSTGVLLMSHEELADLENRLE